MRSAPDYWTWCFVTERGWRAPRASAALWLCLSAALSGPVTAGKPPDRVELDTVTVTSTRTATPLRELAGNTARIDKEAIERTAHTHISELMFRSPGTWIVRGSGQEHLTAIRSPVLTGAGACGGFLFLEDGIPTRPAGFCNVNDLLEINTEQAGAIEVVRGPGSALYGSNALHGLVNVLSPEFGTPTKEVAVEAGSWDYYRGRFLIGGTDEDPGIQAWGHVERDGGFRDDSGYDQAKLNLASEGAAFDGHLRLAVSGSYLRQDTAGFIFGKDAYQDKDQRKSNPVAGAYRNADSVRLAAIYDRELDAETRVEARNYLRHSWMRFQQHFLPGMPIEENGQQSVGTQVALHKDLGRAGALVLGTDLEYMDGFLKETQAETISDGSDFLIETRPVGKHYDYDVRSWQSAAYAHYARSFGPAWRATLGLRYEYLRYDYDNQMLDGNTRDDGTECGFGGCLFNRPSDRNDSFHGLAPKLGLLTRLSADSEAYVSLSRGFRFPQATELYRLQRQQSVADLDPVRLDSAELGARYADGGIFADVAAFYMEKNDAIFRDAQGINESDGETRHVGLEYLLGWQLLDDLSLTLSGTWARHTYRFNRDVSGGETIKRGDDVDTAPRHLNTLLTRWDFSARGSAELEWTSMGSYYMDAANSAKYSGHNLVNLRLQQWFAPRWQGAIRITNLLDENYAERADFAFGNYRYFPGRDRAVFLEIRYRDD